MSPPQNVNTAYLYPMDAYETVELFSTSLKEMRKQLTRIWIHIIVHIIMSYVQGHNINIALRLVIEKPRALARWCCLMPSVLCIGISILTIMFDFAKVFYMDTLALYAGFTVPISIMCYSIILLQKAYTMSQKSRWVLVIGIMLIILQIITPVIMLNVDVMANFELYRRGFSHYPKELILLWFCTSLAVNLFLSSVFSYTAYKQYRKFGSKTWRYLASDGMESMCLVILCNTICTIIMLSSSSRIIFTLSYFIDCSICSIILIENCRKTRNVLNEANRPKTEKMFYISQIPSPMHEETNANTASQPPIPYHN